MVRLPKDSPPERQPLVVPRETTFGRSDGESLARVGESVDERYRGATEAIHAFKLRHRQPAPFQQADPADPRRTGIV